MRIQDLFIKAQTEKRKLFIPFIMGGDPNLSLTEELVIELTHLGADIIEIGVPFSDPVADGVINQRAAMRSLKNNVSIKDCCQLIKNIRMQHCMVPIVLFTYFNPILRLGMENFIILAKESGVDAVLVVDLPFEESQEFNALLETHQLGRVTLISPTTSAKRIKLSCQGPTEFIYYVSRTGVTGTQSDLSSSLAKEIHNIRQLTTLPIAIGFGISTVEHAKNTKQVADAVVVGSALVEKLETENLALGKSNLLLFAKELAQAIH